MTGGLIGLVVALLAATAIGLVLRWRAGRFRPVVSGDAGAEQTVPAQRGAPPHQNAPAHQGASGLRATSGGPADRVLTSADLGVALGERATLVQFSTAFCAPCRPTRQILAQVAGMVDGVVHVDIDATSRLDLVRRLRVNTTPTVLVLGPDGAITRRAAGQPRKADVIAALGEVLEHPAGSARLVAGTGNVTEARIGAGSDSRSESE
jgi:thiol-disulfide isomerase/thioredoxin